MGTPRKDPRTGLSWQIMVTVLLMVALLCLHMVSTTSSSRFLPNFPGDIWTDVTAQPDIGSEDGTGEVGFFQSRRSLSERELVEAVDDFVFATEDSTYSPGPEPTPQICPRKCRKKHGGCRAHCH